MNNSIAGSDDAVNNRSNTIGWTREAVNNKRNSTGGQEKQSRRVSENINNRNNRNGDNQVQLQSRLQYWQVHM